MINNNSIIQKDISSKQEKDTGLALSFLFILIGYFSSNPIYFKIVGPLILLTMLTPGFFKPFAYVWFSFANLIGYFVSKIILSLIFAIIIIPIGLIRKLLGKDNLKLKQYKIAKTSVFIDRNHVFIKEDIIKPF